MAPLALRPVAARANQPIPVGPHAVAHIERVNTTNTVAVARIDGDLDPRDALIFSVDLLRSAIDHAESLGAEAVILPPASSLLVAIPEHADGTVSRLCIVVAPRRYPPAEVKA